MIKVLFFSGYWRYNKIDILGSPGVSLYGTGGYIWIMNRIRIQSSNERKAVTIVVSRMVFPGHEKEYEDWVKKLADAAKESPGNTGVTILIPSKGQDGTASCSDVFHGRKVDASMGDFIYPPKTIARGGCFFPEDTARADWSGDLVFDTGVSGARGTAAMENGYRDVYWGVFRFLRDYQIDRPVLEQPNFWAFNAVVGALLVSALTWMVMPVLSRYVFRKWLYR